MRKNILILCTAAAAMCSGGCGLTPDHQLALNELATDRQYQQDLARDQAERARLEVKWKNCQRQLTELEIGSSMLELDKIWCRPDKINTTKVGSTTVDQWVYDFVEDGTVYLYFRNGRLTGIQY
jgi:hypothetical protein